MVLMSESKGTQTVFNIISEMLIIESLIKGHREKSLFEQKAQGTVVLNIYFRIN